jgi:hypothetical protein
LLFEALFSDHQAVEQVCERFSMTPNAVYSFRNRLQTLVCQIQSELQDKCRNVEEHPYPRVRSQPVRAT